MRAREMHYYSKSRRHCYKSYICIRLVMVLTLVSSGSLVCQCVVDWVTPPELAALNAPAYCSTVFTEGGVSSLLVGGAFTAAGGVVLNHIARWDGFQWSGMGGGLDGDVRCLLVFNDGTGAAVYAGGDFSGAVARWSANSWQAIGSALNGGVHSMAIYDPPGPTGPSLFVGGNFSAAGGLSTSRVARWAGGGAWQSLGSGVNHTCPFTSCGLLPDVFTLAAHDDGSGPALYAGGWFNIAGGGSANYIAKWNGIAWAALGSGLDYYPTRLQSFNDGGGLGLFVGGWFSSAGGVSGTGGFAEWIGNQWVAVGGGLFGNTG